ncbi:hypothetical protein E8E13_010348 [Curvularia kusanoi]|uniref:FAD/NAD(P)-binding domain-containing protein n=1 Tax=Curvularia kusanoi TaxID=90978 RepID=A0A9P4TJ92_CURKU|nr:hypothetical protein E8E13_010348 [Curvularia kusanoi]
MPGKKSVCVVGAGPAGLVAAKTFLQHGGYSVTVFEAADHVGGMWRARSGDYGDKCSPEMRTNLSRFTVAFSDLSWSSVDLSNPSSSGPSPALPMFPKAWQVGCYLEKYAEKFGVKGIILFNHRVINAELLEDKKTWKVRTRDSTTQQEETQIFDYLVIASGFFQQPGRIFSQTPDNNDLGNIQHSAEFRNLLSLSQRSGKIAVIGGGISGSEAAAQAAFQISNLKTSPGESKPVHADSTVYHIVNRPFYCLPRYLPQNPYKGSTHDANLAPTFLPIDLVLYNLSRRGEGEISASITTVSPDKASKGHEFMRSVIGGDQQEYDNSALVHSPAQTQFPAYCGITDSYLEFVRSGLIVPVQGWAEKLEQMDSSGSFEISLQHKEPWSEDAGVRSQCPETWTISTDKRQTTNKLSDIVGIVEATGYNAGLDYLHGTPKGLLRPDTSCPRIPFLLTRGSVLSDLPTLGFVGFYEGPYWGVMETQAHFIAKTWAESPTSTTDSTTSSLLQLETTERMRHEMKAERKLQIPQFWMSDYVGLVEEIAREASMNRTDAVFGGQKGPIFPSRYRSNNTAEDADTVVQEVAGLIEASEKDAKFVAAAVFRAMQGTWLLRRNIASRNTTPGGVLTGAAHFHPRIPTNPAYAAEYLYIEEGTFKMDTGLSFPATRRYVYRYDEATDKITAWFADEDGKSTGAFFNAWDFYRPADDSHGWMAKGSHWCDPDTYKSGCEFKFRGASLDTFCITYEVAGPNKDYSHESWYERPRSEEA